MSKFKMWVLKREITLDIGDGVECDDIIKTLKSKTVFPTKEEALTCSEEEQKGLFEAMATHSAAKLNFGNMIIDASTVVCAKFDIRPARAHEIAVAKDDVHYRDDDYLIPLYDDDDDDDELNDDHTAGVNKDANEIPGAKCINDDDDEE